VNKYNHNDIKNMGLRLIDAVGGSSDNKPCFIVLEYKPPKYKKTICLVGKGVTIDTGGYSIKTGRSMEKMYMDKEGAALSLGLFKYLVDTNYKHRVVCLCPLVENIVSSKSLKPNDVIKSYNGTTVEVVNTDAEGRLILADALAYTCKNYRPDYIFDYATLTGWSERIHCHTSFTYFTLNDKNPDKRKIAREQILMLKDNPTSQRVSSRVKSVVSYLLLDYTFELSFYMLIILLVIIFAYYFLNSKSKSNFKHILK
jgi:leucyl aminopeptidase